MKAIRKFWNWCSSVRAFVANLCCMRPPCGGFAISLEPDILDRDIDWGVLTRRRFRHLPTTCSSASQSTSPPGDTVVARYFGTTARFWLNLQQSHDLAIAERDHGEAIANAVRPRARARNNDGNDKRRPRIP
jgi:hypothetical protein